jgi:hypothetical protein
MDLKKQLIDEKSNILKKIAEFAQAGKSQEVLAAGERLTRLEALINRYEKLAQETSGLLSGAYEPARLSPHPVKMQGTPKSLVASGREIGSRIRMDFLTRASEAGLRLQHVRGSIYQTDSGRKVGIAVATERNPDRWFLGLPADGFDHAVLLCKPETADLIEICIPRSFFDEYKGMLGHSGGQMKFNVSRRGNGYILLVPGTQGVNVTKFNKHYSILS